MNAKQELERWLSSDSWPKLKTKILCARISLGDYDEDEKVCILKPGYTAKEFKAFMDSLDFEYDAGYGSQNLFGIVLFKDKSWLERSEYDGAESWSYKRSPTIKDVIG